MQLAARTEAQTEEFGARLAMARPADVRFAVVFLSGGLGAGKTTLARGFLHALGHSGVVRSPTYTLFECYELGTITVVHADLYRLQHPDEFEGLGLRDLAIAGHVWLIEWPQRGGHWLPAADLDVTLTTEPAFHRIDLAPGSSLGEQWLAHTQS